MEKKNIWIDWKHHGPHKIEDHDQWMSSVEGEAVKKIKRKKKEFLSFYLSLWLNFMFVFVDSECYCCFQITMLGTLSRYLALGTLILTNNNLKWVDLEKIRHAHLLSISLHGNPCLDSDPYCKDKFFFL